MATPNTPPLIQWRFSDWRQATTVADRRDQLIRHIQEVEGFVLESSAKGRALKLQDGFLDRLQAQLDKLDQQIKISAGMGPRGISSFVRGDSQ